MLVRRMATAAAGKQPVGVVPSNPRYQKIQQLQNLFCRDDGMLVWQKMGSKDRFGYYFTMLVMIGGFVPAVDVIYRLSFPPSQG
ncbi:hypothetical protein BaRGS_00018512 [Batillaria attramentaria]|uniref:Uncharacterized protein n=1 Tax=Batillaria attramentaria TaxID=370345 RepID=A0ABD0KTR4_9CAEN